MSKKRKADPEASLQRSLCQQVKLRIRPKVIWFSVPNERECKAWHMANLKAMGLRPGVADLVFIPPGYATCFMELKWGKLKQSPSQIQFENDCLKNGSKYALCYNIDTAVQQLIDWGIIVDEATYIRQCRRATA